VGDGGDIVGDEDEVGSCPPQFPRLRHRGEVGRGGPRCGTLACAQDGPVTHCQVCGEVTIDEPEKVVPCERELRSTSTLWKPQHARRRCCTPLQDVRAGATVRWVRRGSPHALLQATAHRSPRRRLLL
jgi:hypothetical protein